jgi:D-alanyl-D-alanine carboxypeptidase
MEYILVIYPEILAPTTQSATRVYNTAGAYHDVDNTNAIATQIPNLLGSKTGYTDLAGGNLTVAFDLGLNRPIIITVLGSTRDARFSDVLELVAAVQESVTEPLAYE